MMNRRIAALLLLSSYALAQNKSYPNPAIAPMVCANGKCDVGGTSIDEQGNVSVKGALTTGNSVDLMAPAFGCKCDYNGTTGTDDSACLVSALASLTKSGTLYAPAGKSCKFAQQTTVPNDGTGHNQTSAQGPYSRQVNIRITSTQDQSYGDSAVPSASLGGGFIFTYDVTPAAATATISAGAVTGCTGITGGSYTGNPPAIEIHPTGGDTITTSAFMTATMTAGAVTGCTVVAGGAGYTHVPTLTFNPGGKLQSFGFGRLEIDHMLLSSPGATDTVPILYVTGTSVNLHDNEIYSASTSHDLTVWGGVDAKFGNVLNSPSAAYQGYGGVIDNNLFQGGRYQVLAQTFVNHLTMTRNRFYGGANSTGGLVKIDATQTIPTPGANFTCAQGNGAGNLSMISNRYELHRYAYGIEMRCANLVAIIGNDVEDSDGTSVNFVNLDSTSKANQIHVLANAGLANPVGGTVDRSNLILDTSGASGSFSQIPSLGGAGNFATTYFSSNSGSAGINFTSAGQTWLQRIATAGSGSVWNLCDTTTGGSPCPIRVFPATPNNAIDMSASQIKINHVLKLPGIQSTTGTRYVCIGTDGTISSSASACSGS
ncbi:MAG TPA: hypothetical protein VGH38_14135 [Bryobacteraceae bacterium]